MTSIGTGVTSLTRLRRRLTAREAASEAHAADIRAILAAADERDALADARDASADERDRVLDLAEMLDPESSYGAQWSQRRAAALDRRQAKDDRAASREDRMALGRDGTPPGSG